MLADLRGKGQTMSRITGGGAEVAAPAEQGSTYRGGRGLDPQVVAQIRHMFGFDKPPLERYLIMMGSYLRFDFGRSFFQNSTVLGLVLAKLPVSVSIGLWSTLLIYLVSIPLGIAKAVRDGSAVRRRHQRGRADRLRRAGLPVRHPADRAVRRRQLFALVPAARLDERGRVPVAMAAAHCRLCLAHGAADDSPGGRAGLPA